MRKNARKGKTEIGGQFVMVQESARRRSGFQSGTWVRMGDGQNWMFPAPPEPGIDWEYDALVQSLLEPEDEHDEARIEFALAIRLLSRNYDPEPEEFQSIFSFGADQRAKSAAQAAIAGLIWSDSNRPRSGLPAGNPQRSATVPGFRTFHSLLTSCALRVRSTVAPWLQ
jgi:hypothetical protein